MILIRCSLNKNSGVGHLMRCIHIAKSLILFTEVLFFIPDDNYEIENILIHNQLPFQKSQSNVNLIDEINHYPKDSKVILLDLVDDFFRSRFFEINEYLNILSSKKYKIIFLEGIYEDRILKKDHPSVSMIIQPYLNANKNSPYSNTITLAGSNYIIIGSEYQKKITHINKSNRVLITLGGSDHLEITKWVLDNLIIDIEKSYNYDITIITGPNFTKSHISKLKQFETYFPKLYFVNKPRSLFKYFTSTDIAILGSGATSRYEAAKCGVPSIGIGISRLHEIQCSLHSGLGGFNYLGFYKDVNPELFCKKVNNLLKNKKEHKFLSDTSIKLIDGMGSYRIAKKINEEILP